MNLKDELGKLIFYFSRGRRTYKAYLENGQTYLYAQILRQNNASIIRVLARIYAESGDELQSDILDLTHHIDVWSSHWDSLYKEITPQSADKFVFQNTVNYPKVAEENLIRLYKEIKYD
ncbi:MAG: hypothetical protein ACI83B_003558 [Sediminicola sp.]|jgi:hypothetical protein